SSRRRHTRSKRDWSSDVCSSDLAKERKQFNKPIGSFQAIQFKLADMDMEIELARLMYYKAAWLHIQGKPFAREAAIAKLFASEKIGRASCRERVETAVRGGG